MVLWQSFLDRLATGHLVLFLALRCLSFCRVATRSYAETISGFLRSRTASLLHSQKRVPHCPAPFNSPSQTSERDPTVDQVALSRDIVLALLPLLPAPASSVLR